MSQSKITANNLKKIIALAETNTHGKTANYIPELANVNSELTAIGVKAIGQKEIIASNMELPPITLQSTSKLIPLIGLLEEQGPEKVFDWVRVEPSGNEFASIAELDQFGPKPSNPMLNAGAIALCSHIPGISEQRFAWIEHWIKTLFNQRLNLNPLVFASEKRTGDRNRSLAYLLKSRNNLGSDVETTLDLYFTFCSYEATLGQMLQLPFLLANCGKDENGAQVISKDTVKYTLAIMATCGLYDETGTHMVKTGMPAKSGVSGYIQACVPGKGSVAVVSPKVNAKGNSIRGEIMLEEFSKQFGWHFGVTE
jgi:glutaminase